MSKKFKEYGKFTTPITKPASVYDYDEEAVEIIDAGSYTSDYAESYGYSSSSYGYGGYGYGGRSYGGYGYGYSSYYHGNVYNSFKSLKETLSDTLKFLWIDLDLDEALPSDRKVEFSLIDSEEFPKAVFMEIAPDSEDTEKIVLTVNERALKDTTLNKTDIQTLVKSKIAAYYHPFFKTILESRGDTSKIRRMVDMISPFKISLKEISLGSEENTAFEKYKNYLTFVVSEPDIRNEIQTLFSNFLTDFALTGDKAVRDQKNELKSIVDNIEELKERMGLTEKEVNVLQEAYKKIQDVIEEQQKDIEVYPYCNFFASLQADILYKNDKNQEFKVSDVLKNLLEHTSLKGNIIAEILLAHYGEMKSSTYNSILFDNNLANVLKSVASHISLEKFKEELKVFKQSSVWVYESHRFEEFSDEANGNSQIQQSALQQIKDRGGEKGVSGNSEKACEEAQKSDKKFNGEAGGGHGFGEGWSKTSKAIKEDLAKYGYDGPSGKESTADHGDITNLVRAMLTMDKSYEEKRVYTSEYRRSLEKIKKIFVHDTKHKYPSQAPTKRLSARKIAMRAVLPATPIYKKFGKPKPVLKTVNLICDMSGSMAGFHENKMKQIVAIFNELAKLGYVKGKLILSLPSGSLTYNLPVKDNTILGFQTVFGSEGLKRTFDSTAEVLKKADYNFFITDGAITDAPLDKKAIKAKGIHTMGLYVGEPSYSTKLLRWFEKAIVRTSLEDLVNEMIVRLKN